MLGRIIFDCSYSGWTSVLFRENEVLDYRPDLCSFLLFIMHEIIISIQKSRIDSTEKTWKNLQNGKNKTKLSIFSIIDKNRWTHQTKSQSSRYLSEGFGFKKYQKEANQ